MSFLKHFLYRYTRLQWGSYRGPSIVSQLPNSWLQHRFLGWR